MLLDMGSYNNKVKVETPVVPMRSFDLSSQTLTTQNFMDFNVAYAIELPKSKISLNLKSFARMAPMIRPTLGSIQVHNRVFFCPFRYVWAPFENFLTNTPSVQDDGPLLNNAVPTIQGVELIKVLKDSSVSIFGENEPDAYDFYDGENYFVLTDFGRYCLKFLEGLGYKFFFGGSESYVSALPFLCAVKCFFDWYQPPQYVHTGDSAIVEGIFNRYFRYDLEKADILACLRFVHYVNYDSDYFTAAWESPVAPMDGVVSNDFAIPDITSIVLPTGISDEASTVENSVFGNNTPTINIDGATQISKYNVDSLRVLTNYIKRHQLVGSQVLARYLADFGVKLSNEFLRRSYYIGKQSFPIQIQDITSTSDTAGAVLGDYAGKGVAFDGDGNFTFENDAFGYFFVFSSVVPDIAYYQGVDRMVMHLGKSDFLNNSFEELGTRPISCAELIVSKKNPALQGNMSQIFGFTQPYAEYKQGCTHDRVIGDFVCGSVNVGLTAWDTARIIDGSDDLVSSPVHSLDFVRGLDAKQYNRIFYGFVDDGKAPMVDNFYFVHRVNLKVTMSARALWDTYDFDEHGKEITVQGNGIQVN